MLTYAGKAVADNANAIESLLIHLIINLLLIYGDFNLIVSLFKLIDNIIKCQLHMHS